MSGKNRKENVDTLRSKQTSLTRTPLVCHRNFHETPTTPQHQLVFILDLQKRVYVGEFHDTALCHLVNMAFELITLMLAFYDQTNRKRVANSRPVMSPTRLEWLKLSNDIRQNIKHRHP